MKPTIEIRIMPGSQVRAKTDGLGLDGYGAVFNQVYDSGWFRETIKPGAFTRVLSETPDVRYLFNHNVDHVLGRTKSGTLKLAQDEKGLQFDVTLPDTIGGKSLHALVKRGDIDGCSFGFTVAKQTWREEKDPADPNRMVTFREIEEIDQLFDVSAVTYPAYTGTSVDARAALWPAGVPAEVRSRVRALRDVEPGHDGCVDDDGEAIPGHDGCTCRMNCSCRCRACRSSECNECSSHMFSNCPEAENCACNGMGSRSAAHAGQRAADGAKDDGKRTKRVDGEDLPASAFLYVGDPKRTATWSLPWKFKSVEKIKSHLRNALARFNQTSNIPADKKPGVWKKLVAKCKKYGIQVTTDEAKSFALTAEQRDLIGSGLDCQCDCPECLIGDCVNCSEPGCEDPDCDHSGEGDRALVMTEEERARHALRIHQVLD